MTREGGVEGCKGVRRHRLGLGGLRSRRRGMDKEWSRGDGGMEWKYVGTSRLRLRGMEG